MPISMHKCVKCKKEAVLVIKDTKQKGKLIAVCGFHGALSYSWPTSRG